jgi:Zn-dependent protease/CBS domain-containing protein
MPPSRHPEDGAPPPRPGGDPAPGLLVGRPFGVPVYVARSWFVVAAVITYAYAPTVSNRVEGIGSFAYVVAFAFAVLLYLSVLVHELSHSLVALRLGLPVRRITLHLLGGVSEIERESPTPGREFLIAFAGPAVSLVLGGLGAALTAVLTPGTVLETLAMQLTIANLLVGVFNLLPGIPLDGGRVLAAVVWKVRGRRNDGLVVAAWAGRVLAVLVVVFSLAVGAGQDSSAISLIGGLLVGFFIWSGASQTLQSAQIRQRLPALSARALTRRAVPVPADVPLAEALRRLSGVGASALVVVDGNGVPTGIVSEAAVEATPDKRRPWVMVGELARRLEHGMRLSADLSGEELVSAIQRAPATEYLVEERDGLVYGVLATADVERAVLRSGRRS